MSTHILLYCKDEKSDHKVAYTVILFGLLDQSSELHFREKMF